MTHSQPLLLRCSGQGYTCLYGSSLPSSYSHDYIEDILSFQKFIYSLYKLRIPWRIILEREKYIHIFDLYRETFQQRPVSRL